jgi:preprotein translocase subunit YajC
MNWVRSVDWMSKFTLLAQADPEGAEPLPEGAAEPARDSLIQFLLSPFNFMLLIFLLFFFLVLFPQQRQMRAQQKALALALASLKKNDRVVTTSGVHGTIVQTAPEAGTVTIRIDEGTGAKMTVSREAIAKVVSDAKSS